MTLLKTKPSIFPVLLVNFIGMLGYSIVLPILIFMVKRFGGNEFIYGLLGAIYPFFQLIGAPILGKWSDQIGRKHVLWISQIGTFFAWVLFIIALFLPKIELVFINTEVTGSFFMTLPLLFLFIARALDGVTGGNISVANAYLSDISTEENRKRNFGKMGSSTSMGFIVGPLLASLLGATVYGEIIPIVAAALVSLVAIFVIKYYLPESFQNKVPPDISKFKLSKLFQIEHKECYEMEKCPEVNLKTILTQPQIPLLFSIYFLTFLGFSLFYAGFPIYVSDSLNWSTTSLGIFFAISSIIMVIVQGPVLNFLSDKVKDKNLVRIGSLFISISFLFLLNSSLLSIYTSNVLLAIGNGLMWPSFLSILSGKGAPEIQGAIQGYANSVGSLASIFGLILGGILFGFLGTYVFVFGTVIIFIIFLLSLILLN